MIKFLQFRLSSVVSESQGTVTREIAENAINAYLAQGWKLFSVSTAGANQYGAELVIVLTKDAPAVK